MSTRKEKNLARWLQSELVTLGRSPSTYDTEHLLKLQQIFYVDHNTVKLVATLYVQDKPQFEKLYELVKYLHDENPPST